MVLLHGFIKKAKKTPVTDLELAKKRRNSIQQLEYSPVANLQLTTYNLQLTTYNLPLRASLAYLVYRERP
ncbi:type II toxin-antitoxin system RelE/ParE family toxin [Porticoccus sp. GXU_MW_L64]